MPRFIAATVVLLAAATVLVGCTEEKEPEPQWTEESAYAAAEETFRAYWALGLQSEDARDEEAALVTGDMLEIYADDYESAFDGHEVEFRGDSSVAKFVTSSYREVGDEAAVEADACIEAIGLEVRIDGGEWHAPRAETEYSVNLAFSSVAGEMLISHMDESGEDVC